MLLTEFQIYGWMLLFYRDRNLIFPLSVDWTLEIQRLGYGKGEIKNCNGETWQNCLNQVNRALITSGKVMLIPCTLVFFLKPSDPSLIMRKQQTYPVETFYNTSLLLLRTVRMTKTKNNLRNC